MIATHLKNAAASAATAFLLVGILVLIGAGSAVGEQQPSESANEWKVYTYPEQGFSASFPVKPRRAVGKSSINFDAPVEGGSIQYTVAVSAGPSKDMAKAKFDEITEKLGSQVKSKRDIELNGFPGRELVLELDSKGTKLIVTNRMYVANDHFYQAMVTSLKDKKDTAQSKKFLDSFKILDAPKPKG